jgi:hypothetical protein
VGRLPVGRTATGQAAACWIARDGSLFYVPNADSGTLPGYGDHGSGPRAHPGIGLNPVRRDPSRRQSAASVLDDALVSERMRLREIAASKSYVDIPPRL